MMNQNMACKPLYLGSKVLGDRYDKEGIFVFFGNSLLSEKEMDRCFPEMKRSQLKQTHSNIVHVVDSPLNGSLTGDAQLTTTPGIAPTVYTADCLPLLIWDKKQSKIAAVHAGWRGIENRVIIETLKKFGDSVSADLFVWIGPHIRQESFEVGIDVAERLLASSNNKNVIKLHANDPQKRMIDLTAIALSQLSEMNVLPTNVWIHPQNTFTNTDYYSYRRDGKGGRLLSFISLCI